MSSPDSRRGGARRKKVLWAWGPVAARPWKDSLVAGVGGFVAIFVLASARADLSANVLIAPFGASCVLVFAIPQSPLAQPRNVIGGHLISTAAGLSVFYLLGQTPLAFALGVGLAITAIVADRDSSSASRRRSNRGDFRQRLLAIPFCAGAGRNHLHRFAWSGLPSLGHAQGLSARRAWRIGPALGRDESEMTLRRSNSQSREQTSL